MEKRSVIGVWAIISAMTIGFGGCLELSTSEPSESSSSSSGSSGDITSSSSTSSSSSTTSSSSTSSSGAMTSSSSSASSSSSSGMPTGIIAKSNLGTTLLNNFTAVACGVDMQMLPSEQLGEVLECTHLTQAMGYFRQGLTADLQQGQNYTFTFFFKNSDFAMPFDQPYTKIGIGYKVDFVVDGNSLVTTDAYPNGWYRQKISFAPGSSAPFELFFHQSIGQAVGGTYWLYGFQVEEGFTATEYVP